MESQPGSSRQNLKDINSPRKKRQKTETTLYRTENRPIFYMDETWVNAGHTVSKTYVDTTITSKRKAFMEGLNTGAKNPTSKGRRLIVVHMGNENGFVEGSDDIFKSKNR
ncbi:unnamed protein product [Euphydryas editha]|uniref:Transposase n=1 Tax=Euphydryas editha TaxID=104508 RepID=A0AAU9UBU6_EUPED|nr:unnamed protein product [Euphydryas editha]